MKFDVAPKAMSKQDAAKIDTYKFEDVVAPAVSSRVSVQYFGFYIAKLC